MSTVMVIDSEAIIREPIEAALARAGYRTMAAENGADAIAQMAQQVPDLILLEMAMPVMNGANFLARLRRHPATQKIPVIVLTAVANKGQVVEAGSLGVSGYLLKSRFSLAELLSTVQKRIGGAEGTRPSVIDSRLEPKTDVDRVSEGDRGPQSRSTAIGVPSERNASRLGTAPMELRRLGEPCHRSPTAEIPPTIGAGDDPIEVLRSLKPLLTRSQVVERIEDNPELKGLSPAVTQVLKLTGAGRNSTIEQVAKAISQDHVIALKVLKLANSAVYTRGDPVDSVQMAVSRIGLGQIRQTVLNLSIMEKFNASEASGIDCGQFWEHAIATGIIAAEIARARGEKDVDSAFTMGLLHDVGRMLLADQFAEEYAEVTRVARELALPLEQVESRLLLYNHADVMDRVLHSWKFPKQLINPIVYHHLSAGSIRRSAPRQIEEVAILALANRLAHAMMLGSSGNEAIYPTVDICEMLRLDGAVVCEIHGSARDEADKVKFALLAHSSTANWPQLRQVHREALGTDFRPLYVSASPQYDACRIFCEELALSDEGDADMPNLGVIHFTNARDRVTLSSAYRQAEAAAAGNQARLPLLVLSPGGKLLPEGSLTANRQVEALPTPFVIPRFIEAVRRLLCVDARAAA